MKLQKPKGTQDILPAESVKWQYVEGFAREIFKCYNYAEVRTPIFEHYEVISRSVGDTTDIVTKEMYDFYDKGDRHITLRPEGTAPVVRSYVENKLFAPEVQKPSKFYYMGPMFRYERPQKGRQRQFTQFGVELLGAEVPQADVEVIAMAYEFLEKLGLQGQVTVELNSLGDAESRNAYREKLVDYLRGHYDELSEDSKARLERNPLRVLDSKEDCDKVVVENAPLYADSLNENSRNFFAKVLAGLDRLGIKYRVNNRLVRGLDYYSHTVFELVTDKLGAQGTVLAGGRYDGLVEQMGGGAVAGIGWACGVERLAMLLERADEQPRPVAVIPVCEEVNDAAVEIAQKLRLAGLHVEQGYGGNMKKRMIKANKANARAAVIVGPDELAEGKLMVKNLDNGEQKTVAVENVVEEVKE